MSEIAKALAHANRLVSAAPKDSKASMGGAGSFSYRGIDSVVNAVHPALAEAGLVVVPADDDVAVTDGWITMRTRWTLLHESGESLDTHLVSAAAFNQGRGYAVARSYALRELLSRLFTLPTDDDLEQQPERPEPRHRVPSALDIARQELHDAALRLPDWARTVLSDRRQTLGYPSPSQMNADQVAEMMRVAGELEAADEPWDVAPQEVNRGSVADTQNEPTNTGSGDASAATEPAVHALQLLGEGPHDGTDGAAGPAAGESQAGEGTRGGASMSPASRPARGGRR